MTTDTEFDEAVVKAVLESAGEQGWRNVSLVAVARGAGLDLARLRSRFPSRLVVLARFGQIADRAVLAGPAVEGTAKDRLFDLTMRRLDVLQAHRAGVLAVLDAATTDPALACLLSGASRRSMAWLLQAAEISTTGLRGALRVKGLLGVWLWTIRSWREDDSADLSGTMSVLDKALDRAGQLARMLGDEEAEPPLEDEPLSDRPLRPDAPPATGLPPGGPSPAF